MTTIGDTVTVDGERGTSPVPLPLSLSAALAACQAVLAATEAASLDAAGLLAALTAGGASSPLALALLALVPELPTAPTAGAVTLWSDAGVPVVSQG